MCAGLGFLIESISAAERDAYFTPEELAKQQHDELLECFYWQRKPCLPIEKEGEVHLYQWGNRDDKDLKFPHTGWARIESIEEGKWDWLKPEKVHVPSVRGYEKKKWFATPQGLEAVLVELDGEKRAYMLTQPPSDFYKQLTGHDRMPVGAIALLDV